MRHNFFITKPFALLLSLFFIIGCKEDDPPVTDGPEVQLGSAYVLPYPVGQSYFCSQGNGGTFSHTGDGRYAYDFTMEIGTVITASRSGVVEAIREDIFDGDHGTVNYVIIDHGDGTYARYLHLTRNGALVEPGDKISQGDTIALSGNTGFSTGPHLHFEVADNFCTGGNSPECQTVLAKFSNSQDPIPTRGGTYIALPY